MPRNGALASLYPRAEAGTNIAFASGSALDNLAAVYMRLTSLLGDKPNVTLSRAEIREMVHEINGAVTAVKRILALEAAMGAGPALPHE